MLTMGNFSLILALLCNLSKYTYMSFLSTCTGSLYFNPPFLIHSFELNKKHAVFFIIFFKLLFVSGWVAASASLFQTVTVRPDEEVTLRCANLSRIAGHIFWFKLADGPDASRISSMSTSEAVPSLHGEFQRDKFTMRSNVTNIFLDIRQVEVNDSGLYFCGFYAEDFPGVFAATYLHVEGKIVIPGISVDLLNTD